MTLEVLQVKEVVDSTLHPGTALQPLPGAQYHQTCPSRNHHLRTGNVAWYTRLPQLEWGGGMKGEGWHKSTEPGENQKGSYTHCISDCFHYWPKLNADHGAAAFDSTAVEGENLAEGEVEIDLAHKSRHVLRSGALDHCMGRRESQNQLENTGVLEKGMFVHSVKWLDIAFG